jgi:type I restriction enzyme S subunit
MTDLKPGWRLVKFGDVVRLGKESCKTPELEGLKRYIGLEHITPNELRIQSWGDIADGTTFTRRCRPGQVLFGKRRAYQRKVAVCEFDAVCSGDIYVFESKDSQQLVPELLPYICQTESFFEFAIGTSAGSLSPRTNWKSLVNYEFALPPVEEQRRVVSLLDAFETAHQELSHLADSADRLYASTLESHQPSQQNVMVPAPKGNVKNVTLGNLCSDMTYGLTIRPDYVDGGVPLISAKEIKGGCIDIPGCNRIAETDFKELRTRTIPGAGNLLVSKTGTIGRVTIVEDRHLPTAISQNVALLRVNDSLALPRSRCLQRQMVARTKTATVSDLQLGDMGKLVVRLPTIAEQRKAITALDQILISSRAARDRATEFRATWPNLITAVFQKVET